MITYSQIQSNLAKAIKQSNLTKMEIAKQIGVKETTLEKYISGQTKPSAYVFAKLCGALGLDANEILCVKDEISRLHSNAQLPKFDEK